MPLRLVLLLTLALLGCSESSNNKAPTIAVAALLSDSPISGYKRATKTRTFVFPLDHGAHPEYATEWWYLTGNLADSKGRYFGYQFTLFRLGLDKTNTSNESRWRSPEIYMAHLALTDIQGKKHHFAERFSRGAPGLAGVDMEPYKVWLGPWKLTGLTSPFPLTLTASDSDFQIDLVISTGSKPITLQGDQGLSQKSPQAGNASYYYSMTRLPTLGTIQIKDKRFEVQGNSWLDREWSSSALGKDQVGWDWFALQLDDGREIMFYRLRTSKQTLHALSRGSLVSKSGEKIDIMATGIELLPLEWWQSEQGESYPISWKLLIPKEDIAITVSAALKDQLMRTRVRYWEGAVKVSGTHTGRGYMELSGYAKK